MCAWIACLVQQRSSSWLTAAMVNQSVPAAASERSVIPTTVSMRGSPVVHSELNSDTPTGASSAVLNVPPLNVGLINDAHSMHNVLKVTCWKQVKPPFVVDCVWCSGWVNAWSSFSLHRTLCLGWMSRHGWGNMVFCCVFC